MRKLELSLFTKIFFLTLFLLAFGLLMIYSASVSEGLRDFGSKWYFVLLQLKRAGIGLALLIFLSFVPPKTLAKLAPLLMGFGLILLLLVAIPGIGTKVQGARRWLLLPGFSLQPAELIKYLQVIYLSSWLGQRQVTLTQFLSYLALVGGLIMLEPDMGTTIVVTLLAIALYFIHGYPIKHLLTIGLAGLVLGLILIISSPYRMERLTTFLNPEADPLGDSYHIRQVILALGSGGMTGVGIGRSRQKYAYLPESTTDSIFAVVGEELGFLGGLALIFAFIYLITLIFRVAGRARDRFSAALAGGIGAWLALQVMLNLAAMVALTPLTGVPLPLVSYGGSSLIVLLAGIGTVLGVARHERL